MSEDDVFPKLDSRDAQRAVGDYERRLATASPAERRKMRAQAIREGNVVGREIALVFAYGWYHRKGVIPTLDTVIADVQKQMDLDSAEGSGLGFAPGAAGRLANLIADALADLNRRLDRLSRLLAEVESTHEQLQEIADEVRVGDGSVPPSEVIACARRMSQLWRQVRQADRDYCAQLPDDLNPPIQTVIPDLAEKQARMTALASLLPDWERQERRRQRTARTLTPQTELAHCAEPGCTKSRVFFDEAGVGYCKRHGNERGVRPHGKVT